MTGSVAALRWVVRLDGVAALILGIGGTTLTERVESVRGTPVNPMNREEVVAKARVLSVTDCGV